MADGDWLFTALAAAAAALAAGIGVYLNRQGRIAALREELARAGTELATERATHAERLAALERARAQLADSFAALSRDALRANNEAFLQLAGERFGQLHTKATEDLTRREQSIQHLVTPVREALDKTATELRRLEAERKEAYGALSKHLETMSATQVELQQETRQLVQALRRPEVRGQWGELTLRRLAELSGLVEHCDFYEQESRESEGGTVRPDMIVRMPGGREIVVDAKTPLDAYLSAIEATDPAARDQALARHARKMRERVKELALKSYWDQFTRAPDFVVLFVPGDQFLGAALDQDRALLEDALRQKVILATPTSLVALLRAVAFGWRQQSVAENAERIRELGEDLYGRLATFVEHLATLGRNLNSSVDRYNKAVGSLERSVLPGARKLVELGIREKKSLEDPTAIEQLAREPQDIPAPKDA